MGRCIPAAAGFRACPRRMRRRGACGVLGLLGLGLLVLWLGLGRRVRRPGTGWAAAGAAVAVIGIVEAQGVETIVRKQPQPARQLRDLVKIEQYPEYAIA